jgi:hypothetical protein
MLENQIGNKETPSVSEKYRLTQDILLEHSMTTRTMLLTRGRITIRPFDNNSSTKTKVHSTTVPGPVPPYSQRTELPSHKHPPKHHNP